MHHHSLIRIIFSLVIQKMMVNLKTTEHLRFKEIQVPHTSPQLPFLLEFTCKQSLFQF